MGWRHYGGNLIEGKGSKNMTVKVPPFCREGSDTMIWRFRHYGVNGVKVPTLWGEGSDTSKDSKNMTMKVPTPCVKVATLWCEGCDTIEGFDPIVSEPSHHSPHSVTQ